MYFVVKNLCGSAPLRLCVKNDIGAHFAVKTVREFCSGVVARPHPDLLPRGEGTAFTRFYYSAACPANPVAGISKDAANVEALSSPSPIG
jgi:hypothetical protein